MRLQTIELGANQTAERKRQQRSNGKPGAAKKNNLSHDHPYYVALQRAESHAMPISRLRRATMYAITP